MHDRSTAPDDSSLLEGWADEQSDSAFAALVEKYRALVFGAALRRAGQPELARDVSQQVFSLVAARARLLVGHANIAGWLYRTATHIAARALESDRRRQERYVRAIPDVPVSAPEEPSAERWLPLEEAIAALTDRDREAIVLHYFQDLSYAEMAQSLGIEQATVRQRVSRALDRLGEKLRRRGLKESAATALTGAAAWTASVGGTASAASAVCATTVAVGGGSAFSFTCSAIMSHTASKVAATIAALALVPLLFQWNTQAQLKAEIARLPPPPTVPAVVSPAAPVMAATVDDKSLDALRAARLKVERHAAELERIAADPDHELFVSFGSVDDAAHKAARLLRRFAEFAEADEKEDESAKSNPLKKAANALAAAQAMASLPELFATLQNLRRLELDPTKAGRFYATFFGDYLELPPEAREACETKFTTWVSRLQTEGLALPQRPKENSGPWDLRRVQDLRKMLASLQDAPSTPERKKFLTEMLDEDEPAPAAEKEETATMMLDMIFGGAR